MSIICIEDTVFRRKRFIEDLLEPFGFKKNNSGYEYISDSMDGNFRAVVSVSDNGGIVDWGVRTKAWI